jgi:NADPH:quinone reductase-like Zn-dependent oxidoreductase
MQVCEVTEFGGPEVLQMAERPWPQAGEEEVVVAIAAANVNPTDLSSRSGQARSRMPELTPPFVPGWDLAGTVAEVGSAVDGFRPGDAVVGMIPFGHIGGRVGAYAQAAAVEPAWLAPRPDGLDEVTGTTVPLNVLTARQKLDVLGLEPGATLLITGASGAVGSYATQLAVADGLRVLAIASNDDEEWVASLGPAEVLARSTDLSELEPVDALFDAVPIGAEAAVVVKQGGVAVFTRGVEVPDRPDLRVEVLLAKPDPRLAELTQQVAEGSLRTRVAKTLPLAEAAEAHRLNEAGGLRGKIVLTT